MNITSQYGEDGIIAEIFRRIGICRNYCVEFGAWDGKYLSNTWSLWHDQGWSALLIEGDADRHKDLESSLVEFPKVASVCAFVGHQGDNSLENILRRNSAPQDLDLLSIDVDGDEYHIWAALSSFRPRVVVIEHNPTIPPELDLVQKPGSYFGCSAGSLVRLAHSKGYKLAACTDTNCLFVRDEDFPALNLDEPDIRATFPRHNLSYIVNSYDGAVFLTQNPVYSKPFPVVGASALISAFREKHFSKGDRPSLPVLQESAITPVSVFTAPPAQRRTGLLLWMWSRLWNWVIEPLWKDMNAWFLRQSPVVLVRNYLAYQEELRQTDEAVARWRASGSPLPPPHEVKQITLAGYRKRYGLKVLVETGTYHGDMVAAMRHRFRKIYSIELGEELFHKACARFSAKPKIRILQGDSAVVLGTVMRDLNQPALFWLDGHYSAGNTAKGELETPIFRELEHVFSHRIKNHVLLIDDARCFDGTNDYPTLDSLRAFVARIKPNSKMEVADDIIRITPTAA